MVSNKKVLIMMATYNGAQYISKQIDSILKQTYRNFVLAIQDDCSTDATLDIINEYLKKDDRIVLYNNDLLVHGANINFQYLAIRYINSNFDYYMFSDQDDIWDLDKIEKYLNASKTFDENGPLLLYSDLRIIDADGKVICESASKKYHLKFNNNRNLFFQSIINGNSIMMNKKLFELSPKLDLNSKYISWIPYDSYYASLAASVGNVYQINCVTISYRRHRNNISNGYGGGKGKLVRFIKSLPNSVKNYSNRYNDALYEIKLFEGIKNVNKNMLSEIKKVFIDGGIYVVNFFVSNNIKYRKIKDYVFNIFILFFKLQKKYIIKY